MNQVKKIQCILSILYTVENIENSKHEIFLMHKLLKKTVKNKSLTPKDIQTINELFCKYFLFIKKLEDDDNKIGRIALMNDLCYNYYKIEFYILKLQKKKIDSCIYKIKLINYDIEQFNKNYENDIFIAKKEKIYIDKIRNLFYDNEIIA